MFRTVTSRVGLVRTLATNVSPPRKLLRPYDLALQLKQLSADGKLDDAVRRLRSVPRDAQNVPAWNTMLSICMSHKRFQLAQTLFIDMKRRGFSPNVSTFVTMFKGLSQISDWSSHTKQLANAHALYDYYLDYTRSIKHHEPDNAAQLSLTPVVLYISILGAVGDIQKIFDVYFAMDHDGPCAPDKFVFTAMLRAIANHQERAPDHDAASNVRHVWLQIEKMIQKHPEFELDARLVAAAVRALTHGRPADQNLGLDVVGRYLGLAKPGHPEPFKLSPHLNPWTLDAALQLCLAMQSYKLCVHFMHLVMDNVNVRRAVVARKHVHKLMRAHASLATPGSAHVSSEAVDALKWCLKHDAIYDMPDLRPDRRTYHLVLAVCLRTGDWNAAVTAFQLMTGIRADSFDESEGKVSPGIQKRAQGRSLKPDVEAMSLLMRIALGTKDNTKCLHAFWLLEHVGFNGLLEDEGADPYYRASFARALAGIIDQLFDDPRTEGRRTSFASLKARAEQVSRISGHTLKLDTIVQSSLAQENCPALHDRAAGRSNKRGTSN